MWNEDYKEMLSALCAENVEFILIGAYALAAHGFPRATLDMDVWVRPTPANAERICNVLARFGAPMTNLSWRRISRRKTVSCRLVSRPVGLILSQVSPD